MGIKLSTNFDIGAPVPVDSKLVVNTKAGLTTINENIWPEGYLTICLEDKQLYIFNKNNDVDAETGKFRKVAADIDTSLFEKKAQGFMTLEQYNALKEAGNIIEDVDYYIEDTTEDGEANKAINVSYDNANTTLSAVNVQEAITELNAKKQDIVHYPVMPDPNTLEIDAIIQYIGITNEQYKEGRFYKVVEVNGTKTYSIVDTCANDYELKSEPMTQLEYDTLEQLGEVVPDKSYYIENGAIENIPTDASTIAYNNAVSGLNTSNVQGAIDLLQSEKQPKGHYALKSQIPDTSNFVTKAVSNLINYYSKQQTYTKEEVQSLLTNFSTLKMKIVDELPSSDIETNVIYLIKDVGVDSYTQYAYINDVWATLGKTTVDLSNYYTKDESDNTFITESELNTALSDYIKSTDLSVIAEQVSFDNADNGFTANNVQDALEELKESKQDKLSVEQVSALDSGITADKVVQIQDNTDTLATTLQFKTTDITDADELYTENGLYIVNASTVVNLPTSEDSIDYCVEVIRYGTADDALVVQIAYRGRPTDEHPLYMRRKYAGVWSEWVGIASIDDEAVNSLSSTYSSEKIESRLTDLKAELKPSATIEPNHYVKVQMPANKLTTTLLSLKTTLGVGYGTFLISNYGVGGAERCRVQQLQGERKFTKYIDGSDLYILPAVADQTWYASALSIQGDIVTLSSSETYSGTEITTNSVPKEIIDGLISDTNLNSTTSTLSASKVKEAVRYTLNTQDGTTKYVKFNLNMATITVTDIYGGKIEIIGANNSTANPTYKTAKVVRLSYGDWTSYDATQAPATLHTKIGELYYYSVDNYYYLKLYNYAHFVITGLSSTFEVIETLPAETSEMTLIPESSFVTKSELDGTSFIVPYVASGFKYYSLTFGDAYISVTNQGILIQHNRLNFSPVTYIFNATSYSVGRCSVTQVAGIAKRNTSEAAYSMSFYLDDTTKTLYLKVPTYSRVTLTDLLIRTTAVTVTEVNAIPDTATEMTITEYATIKDSTTSTDSTWSSSMIASSVANLVKKEIYYGSQSVDITYNGRMAMIYSSQYADSAGCYMLLSNYNQVGALIRLGGGNNFSVSLAHKSNGVDTATIDIPSNYSWTVIYL